MRIRTVAAIGAIAAAAAASSAQAASELKIGFISTLSGPAARRLPTGRTRPSCAWMGATSRSIGVALTGRRRNPYRLK